MEAKKYLKKVPIGLVMFVCALFLPACNSTNMPCKCAYNNGFSDEDASNTPDAVPKSEAKSTYGNPKHYVVNGKHYNVLKNANGYNKVGYASWYGNQFHGHLTSSHEAYNMYSMTAASTTLPIPTYVKVTNLENGRSVVVKVNDRGPFRSDRIIDLSYAAAKKLGYSSKGTALVRVTAIDANPSSKETKLAQNAKPSYD
jgi:rare lipoprotein A